MRTEPLPCAYDEEEILAFVEECRGTVIVRPVGDGDRPVFITIDDGEGAARRKAQEALKRSLPIAGGGKNVTLECRL